MPKKGKLHTIYGAFKNKSDAVKAEKKHSGSFILERKVRGHKRYVVLKER